MLAKGWNDFSTPTRRHSCRSSSCANECLRCASVNRPFVLNCRRSLARPTIGQPSCDWRRLSRRSSHACAVPLRRLMSPSASESSGSWSKTSWWGTTPSPFVTASQSHRAPHKTAVRRQVGQMIKVTFCVRGVVSPLLANVYLHYAFDLWAQHWRKHRATGDVIIVRYADDIVMGFEQRADAERFLQEWKERLRKFGLELHPDKTRLIEFGRFAAEDRKRRGEGKPETFNFLGFTHICANNQKTRGFSVDRKTIRKRLSAKLKAVREELRRRWHEPVAEVGKWLRSVVQGYFNYHAVPGNIDRLQSFRAQVVWHWSRALQRRSQKSRMPWERFGLLVARWIPSATILHPRPAMRFNARYLR